MTGLDQWLEQATRRLSQDSATQVRTEIRQHFDSAREAAIEAGAAEDEADRRALTALGDPTAANCQYRKVLLTSAEARVLREGNWDSRFLCVRGRVRPLVLAAPTLAIVTAVMLYLFGEAGVARACLIAAFGLAFVFLVPSLPIYTPTRSRYFRYAKWVILAAMPILAMGSDALKFSWLLITCLWPVFWIEWTRHSIRRKLPVARWPKHLYL